MKLTSPAVGMAVLACVISTGTAHAQTLNWFSANVGKNNVLVSDSEPLSSPTATLIYIPTAVTFSAIYVNITADDQTGSFYDIGIGHCPNNDCSVPNVTIDIVCSWGDSTSGIHLDSPGIQSHPCSGTTSVTIQPGVYVLLGVGNAKMAKCQGQGGTTGIQPWATTVQGLAENGSLKIVTIGSFKTSAMAGARVAGDSCSISLH